MQSGNQPPVCLTIAGLDPSGGAGIIADIKTFAAFGCFPAAAVTSITFQNSNDFFGSEHQSAFSILRQIEVVLDETPKLTAKTGMLPTRDIVATVAGLGIERPWRYLVIDPVIRSSSGHELMETDALQTMLKLLFPLATLVTPNIPEAEEITGMKIRSVDDIHKAAALIQSMGAQNVLIKGGHGLSAECEVRSAESKPKEAADYLFGVGGALTFNGEFIEGASARGTGCRLASAIAANLALGKNLDEAVRIAKDYVSRYIHGCSMARDAAVDISDGVN